MKTYLSDKNQTMTRRRVLAVFGGTGAIFLAGCGDRRGSPASLPVGSNPTSTPPTGARNGAAISTNTGSGTTLPIPPVLASRDQDGIKVFDLSLQQGQSHFLPDLTTATLGINGGYLGPTVRVNRGDAVMMNITNHIGESTTLHWHGLHVPAAMDGGPYQLIANNARWTPRFTIMQPAATLWYHPHTMGRTREQVLRGLAGMFIIDDNNPVAASLPNTYGVDDFPLILQDLSLSQSGQINTGGGSGRGGGARGGTTQTLVNGTVAPTLVTDQTRLRFRILNGSSQSFYALGFDDSRTFHQVATDGGLLPAAVPMTRLDIGPGERVEIVVDVTQTRGFTLQSFGSRRSNNGNNGNGRASVALLAITPTRSGAAPALPGKLAGIERLAVSAAGTTRELVLGGDNGAYTINGHMMSALSMPDMPGMADANSTFRVRLGDTELWNITNPTREFHAFHVHDVQFQILDRSTRSLTPGEMGNKDTVVVAPGEKARIIMRFDDFADPTTPYMFHCHMLDHEDEGMMGQFVVVAAT